MIHSLRVFKAEIFKVLGHPTRVAILEYVRFGEVAEDWLRQKVAGDPTEFDQHLTILIRKNIVSVRTADGRKYYSLQHPAFGNVLEAMRTYFLDHLNEALTQLRQERLDDEKP